METSPNRSDDEEPDDQEPPRRPILLPVFPGPIALPRKEASTAAKAGFNKGSLDQPKSIEILTISNCVAISISSTRSVSVLVTAARIVIPSCVGAAVAIEVI